MRTIYTMTIMKITKEILEELAVQINTLYAATELAQSKGAYNMQEAGKVIYASNKINLIFKQIESTDEQLHKEDGTEGENQVNPVQQEDGKKNSKRSK